MTEVLNFLISIAVSNLLLNYFIYFKKIIESENMFQSFFYFLMLIRCFLIILSDDCFLYLIYDIYQFFI